MAKPYPLVNAASQQFTHAAGIVAEVIPDGHGQTAVVWIVDDEDFYQDYRALWCEAVKVKIGDKVSFDIMNDNEDIQNNMFDEDVNLCITSLCKTNEPWHLTKMQKQALAVGRHLHP